MIVPLEHVLVRTDPLLDASLAEVRRTIRSVPRLLAWRARGRDVVARHLARSGAFDPAALAYDEVLLARLARAREAGQALVLVSREDRALAQPVADHLGLFDEVIASARSSDAAVSEQLRARYPTVEVARATHVPVLERARALSRGLRPHQWTKNALVFVPAILAHRLEPYVWTRAVWAFIAFSLCASSVYLVNDLLDLHADRAHPTKKTRPFAAGTLPLGAGVALAPLLLLAAFAVALALPPIFAVVLGTYWALTSGYSFLFKKWAMVDVLILAGLYTLRLLAGGVAYGVPLSQWLLTFSLFLFLSLAFVKRYSEVQMVRREGRTETRGRGYFAGDLEQLSSLGAAAGYLSVLVLALYLNSDDVRRLYDHPLRLLGMIPLLLYWISRVWLLTHRGQMHDDPIVFAIRDPPSYLVLLGALLTVLLAS